MTKDKMRVLDRNAFMKEKSEKLERLLRDVDQKGMEELSGHFAFHIDLNEVDQGRIDDHIADRGDIVIDKDEITVLLDFIRDINPGIRHPVWEVYRHLLHG